MLQYNDNKILPYLKPFINLYDAGRHEYTKRSLHIKKTDAHGKVKPKYIKGNGSLTDQHYKDHLQGEYGLVVCPVDQEGKCKFGVIDDDTYDKEHEKEIRKKILQMELPLVPLPSKSGGIHLTLFLEEKKEAIMVRKLLKCLREQLDLPKDTEIFPKQDKIEKGDVGSCINLPYSAEFEKFEEFKRIQSQHIISNEKFYALIKGYEKKDSTSPTPPSQEKEDPILKLKEVKKGNWHNIFRDAVASMYAQGLSKEAIIELLRPRLNDPNKTCDLEQLFSNLDKFNSSRKNVDTSYLLKDLINHQVKEINYLVDKIIPDTGLVIFAGNPESGKTFFALQLALAIANGKTFLNYPTTKGFVSCHLFEDNMDRLKRRLNFMNIKSAEYDNVQINHQRISINEGLIKKMESEFLLHPTTKLFIIDTLQDAKGAGGSGNAYENDQLRLAPLQSFAMKYKVVVFCIHHLKKSKKDMDDDIQRLSGSMAISGAADLIMQLKKERGKTSAELSVEGRDIEYQNLLIDFDSNKFEWTNEGLYNQAKYSKEKKEILDFLENHKSDLFSPKEIANGLGKKTTREVNNVTRLLRKLLAACDVLQPKEIKGKYGYIPF